MNPRRGERVRRPVETGKLPGIEKPPTLKPNIQLFAGGSKTCKIDSLVKKLKEITVSKHGTRNFKSFGGFENTLKDFESLNLSEVKNIQTKYGPGKLGFLNDDIKVVARAGSKEGSATLEIALSKNKIIKIRY